MSVGDRPRVDTSRCELRVPSTRPHSANPSPGTGTDPTQTGAADESRRDQPLPRLGLDATKKPLDYDGPRRVVG